MILPFLLKAAVLLHVEDDVAAFPDAHENAEDGDAVGGEKDGSHDLDVVVLDVVHFDVEGDGERCYARDVALKPNHLDEEGDSYYFGYY